MKSPALAANSKSQTPPPWMAAAVWEASTNQKQAAIPTLQDNLAESESEDTLLKSLWRSPGLSHQLGCLNRNTGRFKNIPVAIGHDALAHAKTLSDAGTDAYFACAEFLSSTNRASENAVGAWGFWMDLDCGESKAANCKGYLTIDAATLAITGFCRKANLPEPTHLVSSGGGLHVYWMLDRFVPRVMWQTCADKLKALTNDLGLIVDGARTADIASVLRVPGTLNHKYDPPRGVTMMRSGRGQIERSRMLGAIESAYAGRIKTVPLPTAGGYGLPLGRLQLLRKALEYLDADCEYSTWILIGAVIFHEMGGRSAGLELFNSWSRTGAKYKSRREVVNKWRSFRPDHPKPATMATLRWMLEGKGIDWSTLSDEAENQYEAIDMAIGAGE